MKYPIYINGEKRGCLELRSQGLYTLFCADARWHKPVRLWVHGGGKKAYLGLMLPNGGYVSLRRRLTKNDMRTFPEEIQFGAEENFSLQPDAAPKEIRTEAPAAADIGLTWYRGEDGCLRAFDGISILLALPSKLRDPELAKGHLRHIEGKEYLVFRL